MKVLNKNERFGEEGPFEVESFEALADEMTTCFVTWSREGHATVQELREEFIRGLEEVKNEIY